MTTEPRILRNRAQCKFCEDIIESKSVHDFVSCACGAIFVDGGRAYLRRGGSGWPADFIELSEYEEPVNGQVS